MIPVGLRNLDRNNLGDWPRGVKLACCVSLFLLLLLAAWWLSIKDRSDAFGAQVAQEIALRREFHDRQMQVANLPALERQLDAARESVHWLLHQLPSQTEMPALLSDLSRTAQTSGLQTQLFQPGAEAIKDGLYAEKPIQLRMLGSFHQFAAFIGAIAALPRPVILSLQEMSLRPVEAKTQEKSTESPQLMLEATIKIYRYVEEDAIGATKKVASPQPSSAPATKVGT